MNLNDAKTLAELHIEHHLDSTWSFRFNNRQRAFGICDYTNKQIELSRALTEIETEESVEQTILHEIAHAKTPGCGHGRTWKMVAMSIGVKNPTASRSELTGEDTREPKWVIVCEGEIVKKYFRKPSQKIFNTISQRWIRGRIDTKGKLEIMPYAEFAAA